MPPKRLRKAVPRNVELPFLFHSLQGSTALSFETRPRLMAWAKVEAYTLDSSYNSVRNGQLSVASFGGLVLFIDAFGCVQAFKRITDFF